MAPNLVTNLSLESELFRNGTCNLPDGFTLAFYAGYYNSSVLKYLALQCPSLIFTFVLTCLLLFIDQRVASRIYKKFYQKHPVAAKCCCATLYAVVNIMLINKTKLRDGLNQQLRDIETKAINEALKEAQETRNDATVTTQPLSTRDSPLLQQILGAITTLSEHLAESSPRRPSHAIVDMQEN